MERKYKIYLEEGISKAKLAKLNLIEITEAIKDFDKALEINPEFEVACINREIATSKIDNYYSYSYNSPVFIH